MLDKLRTLYEEILFWDQQAPTVTAGGENPGIVTDPQTESRPTTESPLPEMNSTFPETNVTPVPPAAPVVSVEQPVRESYPEPSSDFSDRPQQPVTREEGWAQPDSSPREEPPAEPKLFSDEAHVRTRVDKQVILSLYGEGTPAASRPHVGAYQPPVQPQPKYEAEGTISPAAAPVPENRPETISEKTTTITPSSTTPTPKVLGEVIVTPSESLGDRLGKQHPHTDVASRLRASTITDLQHSIGINDRFLLIRDLFGGDAALYEQTLARLNEFTSLDDAMIYIQENFDWNPDAEGTTFLVELLERKLEN